VSLGEASDFKNGGSSSGRGGNLRNRSLTLTISSRSKSPSAIGNEQPLQIRVASGGSNALANLGSLIDANSARTWR